MTFSNRQYVELPLAALLLLSIALGAARAAEADSKSDQRLARLLARAPEADTDKDGILTLTEARAFLRQRRRDRSDGDSNRPKPTHADVKYDEHARHVIDLYLADAKHPTPVLIYIHGGGFVGGDKRSVSPSLVRTMHDEGISVAAIHYRFIGDLRFPVPFQDAARAVQLLRSASGRYNLDPTRFAATGGSAGAGLSLWLATHDDLAQPEADDPIARQSTRVLAAYVSGAQVSYDPRFWRRHGLARGLDHPSFAKMYGVPMNQPFDGATHIASAEHCSPIHHLTRDDAPVYFRYGVGADLTQTTSLGAVVHHPKHGQLYQQRAKSLGIECHLVFPGGTKPPLTPEAFLIKHLRKPQAPGN
ncbi:MAG: alpha/beta hydrolase [Phycisphaerae bacterium]|nr:alpha/beta hydrolase [Phycisphaerae bacterium]